MAMPVHPGRRERWTRRDVQQLRDSSEDGTRYELVDGELLVTPSPAGRHQVAAYLLCAALYPHVRSHRLGLAALAPRDVDLDPEKTTQPDVFVVPPEEIGRFFGTEPVGRLVLAAEVLSPSSARGDRLIKRVHFQRHRVAEYWIVDLEARVIERWHPEDERPQVVADRLEWAPEGASVPFNLELSAYFAEVYAEDL